jgi:hypothetical protein
MNYSPGTTLFMVLACMTTYSGNEISPSPFVSNNMKNFEGGHFKSPGDLSPPREPSLTRCEPDGGNTGTIALIKSAAVMNVCPSSLRTDEKYSKT